MSSDITANSAKTVFVIGVSLIFGMMMLAALPIAAQNPLLLVAFVLGFVFLTVMIARPVICLTTLILMRSWIEPFLQKTRTVAVGGAATGFGAVLNLLIILMAGMLAFQHPAGWKRVPFKRVWGFFFLIMGISVAHAPDRVAALKLFVNFLSYFAMFTIPFVLINTREDARRWLFILLLSFVPAVLLSNGDIATGGLAGRFMGVFTHPNILAFYLLLGLSVVFYTVRRPDNNLTGFKKAAVIFLVLNMLTLLVMTQTRNAWIALWIMVFFYGLIEDRRFVILALVSIPLALLLPPVRERVFEIFTVTHRSLEEGQNSWEWRVNLWKSSIDSIFRSPIFGYGLASFWIMSAGFFEGRTEVGAHNTYLQVLFESGLVGLIAFVMLLISMWAVIYRHWRAHKEGRYAIALVYLASYMVICYADNLLYYLVLNWYFLFFMAFVLRDIQLSNAEAAQAKANGNGLDQGFGAP